MLERGANDQDIRDEGATISVAFEFSSSDPVCGGVEKSLASLIVHTIALSIVKVFPSPIASAFMPPRSGSGRLSNALCGKLTTDDPLFDTNFLTYWYPKTL